MVGSPPGDGPVVDPEAGERSSRRRTARLEATMTSDVLRPARCPGGCSLAPPYLLRQLAENGTPAQRAAAVRGLALSSSMRARRATLTALVRDPATRSGARSLTFGTEADAAISVFDVQHGGTADLPGTPERAEGEPESGDVAVNGAYDGSVTTRDFYRTVLDRDSVDGEGLPLVSSVHFDNDFDNAFWNGAQMVYGDGSGELFVPGSLTTALDVMAHELTHGVTQYTAGLLYRKQSGALNESMSDVFGSLVKQYSLGQDAHDADWLIGAGILGSALTGQALRSMADPGTAYDGDPQPATMADYVDLPDDDDPRHDSGGVHINSGIPNHAFYLLATALGGNAWEAPGRIWYDTLTTRLRPTSQFADAAEATGASAAALYGEGSPEHQAVQQAWKQVGVG